MKKKSAVFTALATLFAAQSPTFGMSEGSPRTPRVLDPERGRRLHKQRAERLARRGYSAQFRTSEEITGLPPHQYATEKCKRSQSLVGRLFEHAYEILNHRRDCNRCAIERNRAAL